VNRAERGARGNASARVLAPAKLTVSLEVTGVRPDGYHELRAEMVTLDLADELELDARGSGLTIVAEPGSRGSGLGTGEESSAAGPSGAEGEDKDNLVVRALRAAGRTAGVRLTKRIPVGGGLGGGSADAAAVLRWAGCTDPTVALGLGADVPFCVVGGRASVEGIGERVTPLPYERREFLLLVPPFGVDTAAVYRAWDAGARGAAGDGGSGGAGAGGGVNDLTAAALAVEPRLSAWRDAFGGLVGRSPALAGSGSTWFVEGEPAAAETPSRSELRVGSERGLLLRVGTVPAGWGG
jgi:4-diphosphocytidyl-2-C-methyl-D-erythritol kinase